MAKGPGPAVALAGLAALFLMTRKKGTGAGSVNNLPDGSEVDDNTPGDPGSPSGGGTKVPSGTGTGGGKWKAPKVDPAGVWISPDCQTVVEGADYFNETFVPRILESIDILNEWVGLEESEAIVEGEDVTLVGTGRKADVFTYTAIVLNLISGWTPQGVIFSTEPYMYTPPHSCAMQFPAFHVEDRYNSLKTVADEERFTDDMNAYAEEFPQLTDWLMSLEVRLFEHPAVDENSMKWVYALS